MHTLLGPSRPGNFCAVVSFQKKASTHKNMYKFTPRNGKLFQFEASQPYINTIFIEMGAIHYDWCRCNPTATDYILTVFKGVRRVY